MSQTQQGLLVVFVSSYLCQTEVWNCIFWVPSGLRICENRGYPFLQCKISSNFQLWKGSMAQVLLILSHNTHILPLEHVYAIWLNDNLLFLLFLFLFVCFCVRDFFWLSVNKLKPLGACRNGVNLQLKSCILLQDSTNSSHMIEITHFPLSLLQHILCTYWRGEGVWVPIYWSCFSPSIAQTPLKGHWEEAGKYCTKCSLTIKWEHLHVRAELDRRTRTLSWPAPESLQSEVYFLLCS